MVLPHLQDLAHFHRTTQSSESALGANVARNDDAPANAHGGCGNYLQLSYPINRTLRRRLSHTIGLNSTSDLRPRRLEQLLGSGNSPRHQCPHLEIRTDGVRSQSLLLMSC